MEEATTEEITSAEATNYETAHPEPPTPLTPPTLQDILQTANQRRHALQRPTHDDLLQLTQDRVPQTLDISDFWGNELVSRVSPEDAIADTIDLFELLRQFYGAYTYFGGDEIFLPIRDQAIADMHMRANWDTAALGRHLHQHLYTVIRDNHFSISNRFVSVRYNFLTPAWFAQDTCFERSDYGLRNRATGNYVAHVLVNNEEMPVEDVFRHSLDTYGELYYSFVLMQPADAQVPTAAMIVYENGYVQRLPIYHVNTSRRDYRPSSLEYIDGIPVVTIMQMGFPDSTHGLSSESARNFLSFAEELQDEPVIIVDIRNNGGGNSSLAPRWLYALTGELIAQNYYGLRVWEYNSWQDFVGEQPYESMFYFSEASARYSPSRPFDDNHIVMYIPGRRVVPNDQLIILLVDRGTASAGDGFADSMFNMENTLIIGQNTGGVLHTDLTFSGLTLPRSGISLGFGITIFVHPEGHLPEGVGIAPDLWVNGDALTAALALLRSQT